MNKNHLYDYDCLTIRRTKVTENKEPLIKRETSLWKNIHKLLKKEHTHTQTIKERIYTNTRVMKVKIHKKKKKKKKKTKNKRNKSHEEKLTYQENKEFVEIKERAKRVLVWCAVYIPLEK